MAFFFTSFYVATQFYHGNVMVHTLFTEFDYIIPFIILLPILCLTPKFEDNFYIRQEMKYVFICLTLMYGNYYTGRVLKTITWMKDHKPTLKVVVFGWNQISVAMQFAAMLISTFWVNRRCESIIKSNRFH